MRTMVLPAAVITLTTLFLTPVDGQPADEESPAVAAARARQEAVKTLDIKFKWTDVVPKGSISDTDPDAYKKWAPLPATELVAESINRLVIDGEKVRYEDNHPVWINLYAPNGRLSEKSIIDVSNGTIRKLLYPRGILSRQGEPKGIINKYHLADQMSSWILTPIAMMFRGLNSADSITGMKPTGNILPIDWVPCQEYVTTLSKSSAHYWLEPDKDYVIRRMGQTVIHYRRDDAWGWVPESWVTRDYSPYGVLRRTTSVDILELRINEPQPTELFDIQFPSGCEVHDQRDRKDYWVWPDGSLRELSQLTGKGLRVSEARREGAWYWRYKWLLGGFGVILVGLVWQHTVRRKRTNAA